MNFLEGGGAFDDGRPYPVPNVRMREHVLEFINRQPDISNRGLAPRTDTYSAPYITTQQMYPYYHLKDMHSLSGFATVVRKLSVYS